MFIIKTYLDKSKIHNIGLFTFDKISNGDTVYISNPELDLTLTDEELSKMDAKDIEVFKNYGFKDKISNLWRLSFDDVRFINHSDKPNIQGIDNKIIALRDMEAGEELLQNYSDFENLRDSLKMLQ